MKSVNCCKTGNTSANCSKISNIPSNLIFTTKFNDSYDYFMGLFEFVVGKWICWWHHNTKPGYQV